MMFSVVDIAGINAVSAEILGNAAAAIAAMATARAGRSAPVGGRPLIGATMYGATTQCVDAAREWLDQAEHRMSAL